MPLWIGAAEAFGIASNLLDVSFPRPLTYATFANILEASGVELDKVSVSELKGDTFIGTVTIRVGAAMREIDARPSDAINLALQMGRPIYVAESVMEKVGIDISDQDGLPQGVGLRQLQGDLEEKMRAFEEQRRAVSELSDEERRAKAEEESRQMIAYLMGTETDQADE
jgi:bifunctional DNase/RNase